MREHTMEVKPGMHIGEAYKNAMMLIELGSVEDVYFEFNGIKIKVTAYSTLGGVDREYKRKLYGEADYE